MFTNKQQGEPFIFADGSECKDAAISEVIRFLGFNEVENSIIYTRDELGLAMLFKVLYGDDWFYCGDTGVWYHWENENWRACRSDDEIKTALADLIAVMKLYAANKEKQGQNLSAFNSFLRNISTAPHLRSVTEIIGLKCRYAASDLDRHPYIINTPKGSFDLLQRKTVPAEDRKALLMTLTCASTPASKNATCPEWDTFIDEIMSGNEEKKRFLQMSLGYSLVGDNREECMFIAYGPKTRNGKGTLFTAVMNAVGRDYMCTAPADLICGGNKPVDANAPSPILAGFKGKRILSMSESNREIRLNAALIKTLTGRDEITARGLYSKPFTYIPQFTMWLSTNHLPEVDDPGIFASERIRVIEFCEHFGEDRQNKDLKRIFSTPEAAAYIMKWLIHGAVDYIVNGLQVPDCVLSATRSYAKRCDAIGRFVEDRCRTGKEKRALRSYVHRAYRSWCSIDDCNAVPLSARALSIELENRGYTVKKSHGEYFVFGLELATDNDS